MSPPACPRAPSVVAADYHIGVCFLPRTRETLNKKQRRHLLDRRTYVTEVVEHKRVRRFYGCSAARGAARPPPLTAPALSLQKRLYEDYLKQSVGEHDMS